MGKHEKLLFCTLLDILFQTNAMSCFNTSDLVVGGGGQKRGNFAHGHTISSVLIYLTNICNDSEIGI
jgi:hypothetical protein